MRLAGLRQVELEPKSLNERKKKGAAGSGFPLFSCYVCYDTKLYGS